ncbi:Hsp20/alpha crystallin family protein [Pontibacter sp. Tf4]|uniref:Hsp20/alpha crystallin family protein n=1 Tax=Pontibacter sp. Tf4 TaxID=2761620 RepID=UPI001623ED1A|nr:Hsp20/alpha crystallin family protein [Pontibacter sp. Tf4]MBB6610664.1 Hsp20/alpha crystallin family protein [Pontibacter sp. Tf4]
MRSLARKGEHNPATRDMFSGFFSDIDRMFDNDMFLMPMRFGKGNNMPAANMRETEKEYAVDLAVPGMDRNDFTIEVDENMLSVSCQKEEDIKDEKDNYSRREYNYSSFSRTFRLPEAIVADKIKAQYDKGVLHITVPKAEQKEQRRKRINVE